MHLWPPLHQVPITGTIKVLRQTFLLRKLWYSNKIFTLVYKKTKLIHPNSNTTPAPRERLTDTPKFSKALRTLSQLAHQGILMLASYFDQSPPHVHYLNASLQLLSKFIHRITTDLNLLVHLWQMNLHKKSQQLPLNGRKVKAVLCSNLIREAILQSYLASVS